MILCLRKTTTVLFLIFSLILDINFVFFPEESALAANNTSATTTVTVIMVCGDGFKDLSEACDKGNSLVGIPPEFEGAACADFTDYRGNSFSSGYLSCSDDCSQIITTMCSNCANASKEGAEQCDGSDFGNPPATCLSVAGLNRGELTCSSNCLIDPVRCYSVGLNEPGNPGAGGGGTAGGGGAGVSTGFNPGSNIPPGQTKIVIKGKAYPNSDVHILMDGKVIGIIKADAKADFSFETTEVTPGVATFGFWAENKEGIKSTAFSLTFRIVEGAVTTISGAYLAPSISVDKEKLAKGETVKIFGQTIPNADIYITVNSDSEIVKQVQSDDIGSYLLPLDTSPLEDEEFHLAKSLFQISEAGTTIRSGYSNSVSFYVGKQGQNKKCAGADLNGDGRVNLTDFSILLFNWGSNNDCADQNHNGKVDLTDFSIMMYYWTG